jgi:hypothetical protein
LVVVVVVVVGCGASSNNICREFSSKVRLLSTMTEIRLLWLVAG